MELTRDPSRRGHLRCPHTGSSPARVGASRWKLAPAVLGRRWGRLSRAAELLQRAGRLDEASRLVITGLNPAVASPMSAITLRWPRTIRHQAYSKSSRTTNSTRTTRSIAVHCGYELCTPQYRVRSPPRARHDPGLNLVGRRSTAAPPAPLPLSPPYCTTSPPYIQPCVRSP